MNNFQVFDYNENRVNVFGTCRLECVDVVTDDREEAEFIVVDNKCEPILGLRTCEQFRLLGRLDVNSLTVTGSRTLFMGEL